MTDSNSLRVLLVEDSPLDAFLIRSTISKDGPPPFELLHVERLSEALALLERERIDVILTDLNLPDGTGSEAVRAFAGKPIPTVVLTGDDDPELEKRLMTEGAAGHLCKDKVTSETLWRAIREAIEGRPAPR
jgi:DNA-binding NarL/FixJ family response regulator